MTCFEETVNMCLHCMI